MRPKPLLTLILNQGPLKPRRPWNGEFLHIAAGKQNPHDVAYDALLKRILDARK